MVTQTASPKLMWKWSLNLITSAKKTESSFHLSLYACYKIPLSSISLVLNARTQINKKNRRSLQRKRRFIISNHYEPSRPSANLQQKNLHQKGQHPIGPTASCSNRENNNNVSVMQVDFLTCFLPKNPFPPDKLAVGKCPSDL